METNVQPWTPSYKSAELNFRELTKTVGKSPSTYKITTLLIHTLKPLKIRDSQLIICHQGLQTLVCLSKHLPDHRQGRAFFWSVHGQKQKALVTNTKNVKLSGLIQEIKFRTSNLVLNPPMKYVCRATQMFYSENHNFSDSWVLDMWTLRKNLQSRPYWSSWNSIHECLKKKELLAYLWQLLLEHNLQPCI